MIWLAGIVVLLLLVFSTGFRKVAAVIAVLFAGTIAIFILAHEQSQRETRSLIPSGDVDLREIRFQFDGFGSYKLVGRIKDNSPSYTLTGLSLKIVLGDCNNDIRLSCVTIGESEEHPFFENIPVGQVREVSDYIFPGSTKPKGKLVWHYSIAYTEGK
jgi:hypothetical protein